MNRLNDIKDVGDDMTEKNRTKGGASMSNDYYDGEEDYGVENPSDSGEDLSDLEIGENVVEDEIPDVWWADDIRKIQSRILREKEIETAQELLEEQRTVLEKHESGEIDDATLQNELNNKIGPKMRKAATSSGLNPSA